MKTLKQEEIRCSEYRDIDELQANLQLFFDRYYNATRLHLALGYKSPNVFEQEYTSQSVFTSPKMSFRRHEEIYPPDDVIQPDVTS